MLAGVQVAGGAATGLVHISEAADEYVKDLGQLFSPGQSAATVLTRPYCGLCILFTKDGGKQSALDPIVCLCDELFQRS